MTRRTRPRPPAREAVAVSEARGVRTLHLGSDLVQGAMRIARPSALELEYTREMLLPLLARGAGWPRTVLQVGLGAGSLARFLHRHRPRARQTVVEISPAVVAAVRQSFGLPEDGPRLAVTVAEAHAWVAASDREFDLVLLDGFDGEGRAGTLESADFYAACRARLAREGFLAANLLSRRRGFAAAVARLREAFDGRVLVLPPGESGNTVALASADADPSEGRERWRAAAARLAAQTGLDLSPTLDRLEARG